MGITKKYICDRCAYEIGTSSRAINKNCAGMHVLIQVDMSGFEDDDGRAAGHRHEDFEMILCAACLSSLKSALLQYTAPPTQGIAPQ